MEEQGPVVAVVEPPRGTFPARVDDKGRLKLPAAFQEYLRALPEKKLFATTLNGRTVRVYPMDVWRQNEKILDTPAEDTGDAEDVLFLAYHLGGDSEMDSQGRILIPPELRRAANIENQPVKIVFFRGAVDVYSEAMYDERMQQALEGQEQKLAGLRRRGLK
jgi:MraZ protein